MSRTNLLIRLLILVAVATLPAVLVMAYIQHNLREDGRARIETEALRQAELLDGDLSSVIEGARQLSLAIGHLPTVRAADPACGADLFGLRDDLPSYALISVVGEDGTVICAAGAGTAEAAPLSQLRGIIGRGRFEIGTYLPEAPGHGPILPMYQPVTMNDGRRAVVLAGLSLAWLNAHLAEARHPAESMVGIRDRNGTLLARHPYVSALAGSGASPQVLVHVGAARRGVDIIKGTDGKERIVGFVPVDDGTKGIFIAVGLYLPGMLAELNRTTLQGTLLVGAGALLSLVLALVVGQRFVRRPTERLLAAARRWASGDLTARAHLNESPHSEFGSLAAAFNGMAAALGRQRAQLEDLNATLESRVAQRTQDLVESRNRLQVEMAEREKTEASLVQAQKLQAVGQLAGGIAHDFNNLLTAIIGALDLLRSRMPAGQEAVVRLIDNAMQAAERGGKLTGQLLAFSRRQRLVPVPTDLNLTVVALSNLLGSTLGRAIRIQTDLVQDLWPAMVDPAQIEAAIINLAINARDAMPEGGVLTIATRNASLATGSPPRMRDFVEIRVSDTGTGMPPEVVARVFEPFFTTKAPGRGTGLGLSQVHGLAVQSGGDVRIESRPGEGTTVTLFLPRAEAMPAPAPRPAAAPGVTGRRARVLVVDDDDDVRGMTGEMLRERGYIPTLAASPEEAIAIAGQDTDFDLALVDYVMPGMNGAALITKLHALRPQLRTLLMTGHADLGDEDGIASGDILRKPFNVATLEERLERLLAQPAPRPALRAIEGGRAAAGQD